jgi:hypothetical protein
MQFTAKAAQQLAVVMLVAFVAAWFGAQVAVKNNYPLDVKPQFTLIDDVKPCPTC